MLFFITIGILVEGVVKTFLRRNYFKHALDDTSLAGVFSKMENTDKFVALLVSTLPEIVGLLVFFGTSYFLYSTLMWTKSPYLQLLFLSVLLSVSLIRVASILSLWVFSPHSEVFRVLPINSRNAKAFHRLLVCTVTYTVSMLMMTVVVFRLGAERSTVALLSIFFVGILLLVSAIIVIAFRDRAKVSILDLVSGEPSWGRRQIASFWHIPALLYLLLLLVLLVNTIDSPRHTNSHAAFVVSFFVLPMWLIADRFIQWVVRFLVVTLKIHDENSETAHRDGIQWQQGRMYYTRCNIFARLCLVFALLVWVASFWGVKLPFISQFTSVFFDASVILATSLLFWQFVSNWIDRKIKESSPEDEEAITENDEWGGTTTRGRSYTLLPMVRKFVGSVLVIMVSMTILSSMGVNIGPLLAGAGVIGIAIGFGAQKLVSDIFSGFFYLLDDAFRVGEYLEAGSVSGSVEKITLRNVMLRHHRGMLQIVPHSELGAITNFMRGGIVVKFNLDFPYDANIDKIRKVIKKVGQAMLTDEEFGKNFIRPVKSQGVREIANSVMTIRVKFTAEPGSHFVIRREAFKRITEALLAQGIQYAHRKVIVDVPATVNTKPTEEQLLTMGAAALEEVRPAQDNQHPT